MYVLLATPLFVMISFLALASWYKSHPGICLQGHLNIVYTIMMIISHFELLVVQVYNE